MASANPKSDTCPKNSLANEERKRKRMESNRVSAKRSRMRKQQQMGDFINVANLLKRENSEMAEMINSSTQRYNEMESKNNVLRAQVMELTDRLRSLNSVLQIAEEVNGFSLDIPEVPMDSMSNPWQLTFSGLPIMASVDAFQC